MALADTFVRQVKYKGLAPDPVTGKAPSKVALEKYTDGGGMYLLVKPAGKYWRMDYTHVGKRKTLALGVYPDVTLAMARERRRAARTLLADGIDPNAAKREERLSKADAAAHTFEAVAKEWLIKTKAKRVEITQTKITAWLEKDVYPYLGRMPISNIGPRDVLSMLRKVESRSAFDSAHRIKQVCGQIFRFAVAEGTAERDVTTDLKGALADVPRKHFAAITEPKPLGDLMRSIYAYSGHSCTVAALKLTPLVFVRPGELRTAEWAEIDLDVAEWRIPGRKMKMREDHIVPLAVQAVELLRSVHPITGHGQYVFPSLRTGERPMSENTINAALRGMGYSQEQHSAHGFRATARTIMDEVLDERVELIEHQLAHQVRDATGRAYNRTAHLPARRAMMQRWADYLDKLRIGAEVIQLKTA